VNEWGCSFFHNHPIPFIHVKRQKEGSVIEKIWTVEERVCAVELGLPTKSSWLPRTTTSRLGRKTPPLYATTFRSTPPPAEAVELPRPREPHHRYRPRHFLQMINCSVPTLLLAKYVFTQDSAVPLMQYIVCIRLSRRLSFEFWKISVLRFCKQNKTLYIDMLMQLNPRWTHLIENA
jgi:hypothetical protein